MKTQRKGRVTRRVQGGLSLVTLREDGHGSTLLTTLPLRRYCEASPVPIAALSGT